ncbi:Phage portal protein, lambda family [Planctomycetales bacterium 10988]|nr:Phage portal protein, lambda family [Planctomycetales bacterium 10988]
MHLLNRQEADTICGAFESIRGDYQAARSSRLRRQRSGVPATGASADYHYRSEVDFLKILEYCRDFDRNDAVIGQAVNRACDNIVQGGFQPAPDTGDKQLDAELTERWKEWSDNPELCDIQGELPFAELEWIAWRQKIVDGDVCGILLDNGSVQLMESHRLRTPGGIDDWVVHGVRLGTARRRLEYLFTKEDVDPWLPVRSVTEVSRYPVRDALGIRQVAHLYRSNRYSQTRGVSDFAPVFDVISGIEDLNLAKIVQAQIVSCIAFFLEQTSGAPPQTRDSGKVTYDEATESKLTADLRPGAIKKLPPGTTLKSFSPNVPNPEFFQHLKWLISLISVNLGMPLVLVMLDASETNFSGWRGAIDQAKQGWKRNQDLFIRRFHSPIWKWKLTQWSLLDPALMSARERLGNAYYKNNWQKPGWPYIEPLKDTQADVLRLKNVLISPRRVHSERGRDYDVIVKETIEDNASAIEAAYLKAEELKERLGIELHWRELLPLPMPEGVSKPSQPKPTPAEDQQDEEEDEDA